MPLRAGLPQDLFFLEIRGTQAVGASNELTILMDKNKPDVTDDRLLGGRLRLRQLSQGHRAGTDALLLAGLTPPRTRGLILDIGAGTGAVGLVAALRAPQAQVGLLEIDACACALARDNILANDLDARIGVFHADVLSATGRRAAGLVDEQAAVVLTNPPFFDARAVRVSPDADKARAHVETAPLANWLRASLALLAPGGIFAMIHRAEALANCLAAIDRRLGGLVIRPVSPRANAAATRILLHGVKGSKAPLTLAAPLVLHEDDGRFSPDAMRLALGEPREDYYS